MNPKDFVTHIRAGVINDNLVVYKDLFENTSVDEATDKYWKRALLFFGQLTDEQRCVFFEILRQVSVDTTSNILGVVDGVNYLQNVSGEFFLTYGKNKILLNGDLQNIFLAEEEKSA